MSQALQVELLSAGLLFGGEPLSGGLVYTYEAGTTTPKTTWTDAGKTTAAANPIVLDSNGRANIFADGNYKFDIRNSADVSQVVLDNQRFLFPPTQCYTIVSGVGGSTNTYEATATPAPVALITGMQVIWRASSTQTGTATFNLNGLGAVTITLGSHAFINSGDLVHMVYNGSAWLVISVSNVFVSAATVTNASSTTITSATGSTPAAIADTALSFTVPTGQVYLLTYKIALSYSHSSASVAIGFRVNYNTTDQTFIDILSATASVNGSGAGYTDSFSVVANAGTHDFSTRWESDSGTHYCLRRYAQLIRQRVS